MRIAPSSSMRYQITSFTIPNYIAVDFKFFNLILRFE